MAMRILTKMLKGYAVFWPKADSDGQDSIQTDRPIEIRVRWEDTQQVIKNIDGNDVMSKTMVNVDRDFNAVDSAGEFEYRGSLGWGYLLEGRLTAVPDSLKDDPIGAGAFWIEQYGNLPTLDQSQYLRTAWL